GRAGTDVPLPAADATLGWTRLDYLSPVPAARISLSPQANVLQLLPLRLRRRLFQDDDPLFEHSISLLPLVTLPRFPARRPARRTPPPSRRAGRQDFAKRNVLP